MTKSPHRSLDSAETLRTFVHNLREGIYITNLEGELLDVNPAFLEILGVESREALRAYSAVDLFVDPDLRQKELDLLHRDGAVREFEIELRRPDGQIRTLLDTCYLVHDEEFGEVTCHGILIDITARKELEVELHDYSIRDPLTGCYNRRYLALEGERLNREHPTWGAIVIDIDHFKDYNDRYGHAAGDEVLIKVSRFLMRHVRAEDPVVRIGGDEFLCLLLGNKDSLSAPAGQRIREVIEAEAPVPLSFGWALRDDDEPLQETIGRADRSLIQLRIEKRGERRWGSARR